MKTYTMKLRAAILAVAVALPAVAQAGGANGASPTRLQLERDAGNYVRALVGGASKAELRQLQKRWALSQALHIQYGGGKDIAEEASCLLPHVEAKRTGRPPMEVLTRDCFGFPDPAVILTESRYID